MSIGVKSKAWPHFIRSTFLKSCDRKRIKYFKMKEMSVNIEWIDWVNTCVMGIKRDTGLKEDRKLSLIRIGMEWMRPRVCRGLRQINLADTLLVVHQSLRMILMCSSPLYSLFIRYTLIYRSLQQVFHSPYMFIFLFVLFLTCTVLVEVPAWYFRLPIQLSSSASTIYQMKLEFRIYR